MVRCVLTMLLAVGLWGQTAPYDIIISGARVVDGSCSPWFLADIGIRGDSIAAVGALGNAPAGVRIDAKGMVAAPGFIDIWDRGMLRPGMKADVIVFDPATVADRAEYDKPHQYSVVVHHVLVNGKFVLRQDQVTAERPGRVLPGPSAER